MAGSDKVREEYGKLASSYDEKWSFYIRATTTETLKRATLAPGMKVLDVGCGTGALLARLAEREDLALAGVEPVPEMLRQARARLPGCVVLKNGWAEELPFGEAEFDVVTSCSMFHYIRRPEQALQEMKRVLKPGGRLIVTDWCDDYLSCRVCELYLRVTDPAHFKTYKERECCDLLRGQGFAEIRSERYKINWLWGLMTVQGTKP